MRTALLTLLTFTLLASMSRSQTPNEQLLVVLANQSRAEHNLPPLTWDPALARAAHAHLAVMARQSGQVEHQYPGEPDLVARAAQAGVHFSSIAENVAGSAPTAAVIHELWMNSPHHRDNILASGLTTIGIAVAATPSGLYAVEDFARGASSTAGNAESRSSNSSSTTASSPTHPISTGRMPSPTAYPEPHPQSPPASALPTS